ncbi:MAG: glycosyltransferase [Oceanococcus sp.]
MKIVFLIAPGLFAGAEAVVLAGARHARQCGIDVQLYLLQETRAPQYADDFASRAQTAAIPFRLIPVSGRLDFSAFGRLRKHLELDAVRLVHAHGYKALIYCLGLQRSMGIPVVATHHGVTSHTWLVRLYHRVEFQLLRHCRGVIAVSEPMREMLLGKGISVKNLWVQENPLALDLPNLARLPEGSGRPSKMLVVGRLSPEKGLNDLLCVLAESKNWQLRIVGDGPQRAELEALSASLGLQQRVEFVGFQRDVRPYMQDVDIYALPSLREGLPLALIEAAASGLPALVSAVGATSQVVKEGYNGRVLPPSDVAAWSQALLELHTNDEAWQAMRRAAVNAAQDVRQRYSLQTWVAQLENAYQHFGIDLQVHA